MLRFLSGIKFLSSGRISRRGFLKAGVLATAYIAPAGAMASKVAPGCEKTLSFFNTHTGESLKTVYRAGKEYVPESIVEISHILRDHHTGEVRPIDVGLLDLLHALGEKLGTRSPFHIISGYRSPATNDSLRAKNKAVAKNSLHLCGKAVDIRLPGRNLRMLRKAAVSLHAGGVGHYPRSGFVHVDVGPVRYW